MNIARVLLLLGLAVALGAPARAQTPAPPDGPAAFTAGPPPIFVLNSLDASVSVIDPRTWREVRRIPTGKEPHHLYMTPDEKSIIVANAMSDTLTFLDPRTAQVQRTLSDIIDPYQLRFSPDMKWFVTAANRLNHVDIYRWDGRNLQLANRIPTGKTPSHIWIDSRSTTAWVTMQDSDELVAIDLATQKLKWRAPVGSTPADVYGTPDDRHLLVALTGADAVEVYDVTGAAPRLVKSLRTGGGAHGFRAVGDRRHVLVSNRVANSISRIDLNDFSVVAEYPAPGGPDCLDLSADGKFIYVASRWARKLTVVDLESRKVVRQVRVGKSPHGVWTLDHAPRR